MDLSAPVLTSGPAVNAASSAVQKLPVGWTTRNIANFCTVKTGPFGTLLKADEYSEIEGVPVISVGEIREGYFRITENTPLVPESVQRRLPQYLLRNGDVVFGRKGAVERSALVRPEQAGWFLGSDGIAVRPVSMDCSEYIAAQFQSFQVRQWLMVNSTGTTMASMNQGVLSRVSIPFPPTLSEQQAISSALTDADALIDSLEQLLAKKRQIKQGAMQELLTGKRLSDWKPQKLENICSFITKGSTPTTYGFEWESDGVLFLRSECVSDNGLDLTQSMFISEKAHAVLSRSEVLAGDLLMTITGNVGRVVRVVGECHRCNINQHIARLRIIDPKVSPDFVFYQLSQKEVRRGFEKITTGQAYPQISLKQVRDYVVHLPEYADQIAIAQVLSDMDADIAATEARLTKARDLKQAMAQALLTGRVRLV